MGKAFSTKLVEPGGREWMVEAYCVGATDVFFSENAEDIEIAKEVCGRCAVREACLEYAIRNKEKYGVWGGTDEDERKIMIKHRRRAG